MARKKKNDMAIMIGAIAVTAVVAVALIAVLVVRGMSAGKESSSSSSSSETSSETSSISSSSASSSKAPSGPAGPVVPEISDKEDGKDQSSESSSESISSESSSAPATSAPSSSSSSAPVTTTKAPVTTTAPATTTKAPVTTTKAPVTTTKTATTQLATPEMEIGVDDGAIYVSWDPVSHASGYLVQLFDADDESKALEEASLEDDEDYYAFDADLDKDIVYKVKLQALGTGAYYDSNRRVKTVTVESGSSGKQLSTPKNLEAYLDEGELTIEWDAVDGAVSYTVELIKPNGKVVESDTTDGTGYIFDTPLDEIGIYKARVCANPKKSSGYSASEYVTKSVRTSSLNIGSGDRLAAPVLTLRKYNEYLKISWEPVKNATEYYLEIIDPSGATIHSTHLMDIDSPYEYWGDMLKKGTYQIRMKAIDDEGEYSDSTTTVEKLTVSSGSLETPSISDVSVTTKAATVSFDAIEDAEYYQIQIYDASGSVVTTVTHTPSGIRGNRGTQSKQVSGLKSGKNYRARVRACTSDSDTENSSWSSYYDFTTD